MEVCLSAHQKTPKSIYKIMSLCWSANPANRPCFRTLHREFDTIEGEIILIQDHMNLAKKHAAVTNVICLEKNKAIHFYCYC